MSVAEMMGQERKGGEAERNMERERRHEKGGRKEATGGKRRGKVEEIKGRQNGKERGRMGEWVRMK